ncbi:GvpL/GvpF family gas vesicle protein [Kitasatospora sp. NPDC005751]|uniref:GvpL/GvpF family gas vesicle protein n=1 Tax=unclassified Kitasatospora TaxID=2633591 RepID=UPI0033FA91AF
MAGTVVYAYAIARTTEALGPAAAGAHGIAGAPVLLLHADDPGLAAAVSRVPAEDFRQDALAEHLEDLQWLETAARAHHAVVAALAAVTTVLPLRLATVYFDDDGVRSALDARQDEFTAALDRLVAQVEWGVKIYVEARAPDPVPEGPPPADVGPGRAYLHARRAVRDRHAERYRAAEQAAARVEAAAARLAVARAHHRVHSGEPVGEQGENVLNDAYLVPVERAGVFREDVLRAGQGLNGVRVEVTGPWAPYSFAVLPQDEPTGGERPV